MSNLAGVESTLNKHLIECAQAGERTAGALEGLQSTVGALATQVGLLAGEISRMKSRDSNEDAVAKFKRGALNWIGGFVVGGAVVFGTVWGVYIHSHPVSETTNVNTSISTGAILPKAKP